MRHIVALSGGKDSAALALYLKGKVECEYVFYDTGRELPEVYEFLNQLEVRLGTVNRVRFRDRDFDWYLRQWGYMLPSPWRRWCTRYLKIYPYRHYVGKDDCIVYIGIRADEDREGKYDGAIATVAHAYPLKDAGIDRAGVLSILDGAGIKLPDFYRWRSTGGCWCCPFQRKSDWAGLKMFHPDLFQRAVEDEEKSIANSKGFTWRRGSRLTQIEAAVQAPLEIDEWEDRTPCLICAK
ncbi:hypothetical protein LCGC14_0819700 [marine sediment metagenome]|uniref:Phosphoadenosine phosphosulphate reductase domain-containing protein n=1 Tax=marine sediment metagenome TaxID=412755 RepID=A0A0F9S488_9ZZZZ